MSDPEVEAYLGRGRPKSELRVNFNRGFEKMFEELSLQISKNLVTSEYAKVKLFEIERNTSIKLYKQVLRNEMIRFIKVSLVSSLMVTQKLVVAVLVVWQQ
jgi:hypothetical protein